ncbi:MAG: SNF2 helicase-associated domain-containing protein, partial [Cyanobacteriota bacterium]|nr:SNF2 helicase-associated domain-containing protein [Cyanobacteriota bacterium]
MAILHGSWLLQGQSSCFFIWGETWRSISSDSAEDELTKVQPHPFGLTPLELLELLQKGNLKIPNSWLQALADTNAKSGKKRKSTASEDVNLPSLSIVLALPTHIPEEGKKKKKKKDIDFIQPFHSGIVNETVSEQYLYSWQVEGFCLNSTEAVKFLTSLPMNVANEEQDFIGGDLRFWSQISRWGLDLIARCKLLPSIQNASDDDKIASWEALLDSAVDGSRLDKYSRLMPLSCRVYQRQTQGQTENDNSLAINLPPEPEQLLLDFLNKTVDAQVREMVNSLDAAETRLLASLPSVIRQWLHSLTSKKNSLSAETQEVERLEAALNSWTLPLQNQLGTRSLFRTCFALRTPEEGETKWLLEYYLQAIDDKEFLLDAKTIWNHPVEQFVYQNRTINKPQETFLRGLGLASRLYPIMIPSLDTALPQSCRLEPMQAYDFIKTVTWRFEDSGLGVILPDSLSNRDGWANRLGLKVSAQTPKKKTERLGLQSLLNFKWELAIGGQTLSKQQFDKLVALNSPLVQINDEWVELRPQDIKTAQTFFAGRKEKMSLSLEDALRLGSGDTQTIEKLPVVSFEASGALQELINNLTDNQDLELLPTPESFHGELRSYQKRGMSWLSFLERWGLGACLADDMGLGKCVAPDTQIYINGCLKTAENIWENYARETQFDSEGFWAEPSEQLIVNSINESTGKIIQAPIRKLYRQQVKEKLRKIKLQDGSSITITLRHKLLTNKGWTNNLEIGDYIGIPAKKSSANLRENLREPLRFRNNIALKEKPKISQEISYCKIESIENVDYEGWVYDFEVEE